MDFRLTDIDSKLPNLALMQLANHVRKLGDDVHYTRDIERGIFEPKYLGVYGSTIFTKSSPKTSYFLMNFPDAIVGGTGAILNYTLSDLIPSITDEYDYSIYPDYKHSIGFLQRGCRLKCKFCVVPTKEGKVKPVKTVFDLWRGEPHSKTLMLLDNDFFGNPQWRQAVADIREGGFRVCFSQGINVRLIGDEQAEAIASIEYRNTDFNRRRIYTAWDNLGQEKVFYRGIGRLIKAGIEPKNIMVYMLVGYAKNETWEQIHYRFDSMVAAGLKPFPMVYDESRKDLKRFQRWAVTGLYRSIPFSDYR